MTTSKYLNNNIPQILINWSKEFIRDGYSDMSAYVNTKASEYASELSIDKDMTKDACVRKIRTCFLSPVKILTKYKAIQQNRKQPIGVVNEINKAIKYYNKF
jgi:hypothetical protein